MGTYSGSVFCVLYQGDTRGCEAALTRLYLLPNEEYRYVFDDGSGEEAWREAYREERAQCAEHKARTGREWLTHWSRPPLAFPVHTVEHIGDTISVQTSSPPLPLDGRGGYEESHVKDGVLTLRALSTTPAAFEIRNFLSDEEADHLIELGGGKVQRSTIQSNTSKVRTSRNAWLPRTSSPITERISRRAADLLGVEEHILWEDGRRGGHAESMQLVHYQPGQQYEAHFDWQASAAGTRFATVLLYLNSPPDGGWTAFPRADSPEPLLVQPVKGTAVLFYNMLPDGNADVYSLHAALPTRTGEKWLANLWVWDAPRL
jgi:prolyl 4-hydroxylase